MENRRKRRNVRVSSFSPSFPNAHERATTNLLKVRRAERPAAIVRAARKVSILQGSRRLAEARWRVFPKTGGHKRANQSHRWILSIAKSDWNRLEIGPTRCGILSWQVYIHRGHVKGKRHSSRGIVNFSRQRRQLNERTKTLRHIPLLSLSPLLLPPVWSEQLLRKYLELLALLVKDISCIVAHCRFAQRVWHGTTLANLGGSMEGKENGRKERREIDPSKNLPVEDFL